MSRRGIESVYGQLFYHAEEVEYHERRLAEARRVRDLLVVKLSRAGESTRQIGEASGISSPGISWIVRRHGRKAVNV